MEVKLESLILVVISTFFNNNLSGHEGRVLDRYSLLLNLAYEQALEVNFVLVERNKWVLAHGAHLQDSSLLFFAPDETADHSSNNNLSLSAVKSYCNFFLRSKSNGTYS